MGFNDDAQNTNGNFNLQEEHLRLSGNNNDVLMKEMN